MTKCSNCGNLFVPGDTKKCPQCGHRKSSKGLYSIIGLIIIVIIIFAIKGISNLAAEPTPAKFNNRVNNTTLQDEKLPAVKLLPIVFVLFNYKNEVPINLIKDEIQKFYHIKVEVVKDKLPAYAYSNLRNRYKAQQILNYMTATYPRKRVIGLTSSDICTPAFGVEDWGIFGLGSLANNVSITSTYRLKGDKLTERTIKIILHEIGHSYGLQHCNTNEPCFMKAGDHTLRAVDLEQKVMCSQCRKKMIQK